MSSTWQERYLEMLDRVCQRPGMYVGGANLRLIDIFLSGYELGLVETGNSPELDGWGEWVWLKFQIYHPAWSTTRILVHSL
ncbi:MAG: hypothetical protein JWN24_4330 [Phycisphaerales bacterium]|nr:hypothetical protein [Phycisphaerales bacterium]